MSRVRGERDLFAVETLEGEGIGGHATHPGCAGGWWVETCQGNGSEKEKISAVNHGCTITCRFDAASARFREKTPMDQPSGRPGVSHSGERVVGLNECLCFRR